MKAFIIFGLFALLAIASAVSLDELLQQEWQEFKVKHGKSYTDEREEQFRMKVYLENRRKIAQHNARNDVTFTLAMNQFGDILHHEFVKMMNGYNNASRATERYNPLFMIPENVQLAASVDWREKGYVTEVKNQGQCGSCWAFSATGALEGQHFRKTGKLVSLSEQNLVDCSGSTGNQGCNGGLMDNAFSYIKENKGIDTEKSYPYQGVDKKCRFKKETVGATDTGFVDIKSNSEKDLAAAIATVGPVSVAIDAGHSSFQFYSTGVYFEPDCSSENLDHGVLAVGYGQNDAGDEYFIVKNSWGESWGDKGYILMAKNKDNHCGIATQASYPTV